MEDSSWQEHGDLCHNDWCQHDYMTPGDWARPGTVRDISFKKLNIQVSVAVGGLEGCQGPRPVNETSLTVVVNNSWVSLRSKISDVGTVSFYLARPDSSLSLQMKYCFPLCGVEC